MTDRTDKIVASLTPDKLRELVLELSRTQPKDDPGIMVNRIIDALTQGKDVGTGSEGWEAFLRLQQAVKDMVAPTPGLKYIEADS